MATSPTGRILSLVLIALCSLAGSARANADGSYELTRERHIERINGARANAPTLVDEAFGDRQSLYDGTVTFSNVDVSIPGNNGLPVELRRTYSVDDRRELNGSLRATGQFGGFGEWSLDLPNLHGTFAEFTGWKAKVGAEDSTNARCSTNAPPPPVGGFSDFEYWDGYILHIPGAGDQQLVYSNGGSPKPSGTTSYPWTTKSFWMISCKSGTANGYPGEAFVATSPEGVKYTFDWVVSRETAGLSKPAVSLPTTMGLSRVAVYFLVSRIEDRFGNQVNFTYNGDKLSQITSSDGRRITISSYPGSNIAVVDSDLGQWKYAYVDGRLSKVTRPDGTTWEYTHAGTLRIDVETESNGNDPADECNYTFLDPSAFTYTVTNPAKAQAQFNFVTKRFWRQYVPRICIVGYMDGPGYLKIPLYHDVFSLAGKIVTGPGLSAMTWAYEYGSGQGAPPSGYGMLCDEPGWCPTSKFVTITGPDATFEKLEYGIVYEGNEGQLLSRKKGSSVDAILEATKYTYVTNDTASSYPFANSVGYDPRGVLADRLTSSWLRPLLRVNATAFDDVGGINDTYVVTNDTFDNFARPLSVTRSNSGGASRTDVTAYYDHLAKWVLGQTKSVTNTNTGKVSQRIDYYSGTALPQYLYAFGLLRETRAYEVDGTLKSVKDGLLRETTLSGWYRGIPRNINYPDPIKISIGVDAAGNVESVTNEKAEVTSYGYDAMGRLATVTYPSEPNAWAPEVTTRQFVSGELGVPDNTWRVQVSIGTHRIRTYYDALMRPVLTEDADESSGIATYSRASFDHRGLATFKSYPSSSTAASAGIQMRYDALGRLLEKVTTDGVQLETSTYLPGNRRRTTDAEQNQTTIQYQAFGEPSYETPLRIESPESQLTVMDRDVFGKIKTVTQSGPYAGGTRSATRTLTYDKYERLCMRSDPESGQTLWGYDAASQMTWEAKGQAATACPAIRPGTATTFTYWPRGWPKAVDHAGTSADITYTYEPTGNIKTVANPTATWSYTWNKRGLVESESASIDGLTFTIDPEYNARGDVRSLGYPGGRTIAFAPDASGRPTQLGSWVGAVKYHPNGIVANFNIGPYGQFYDATLNSRQWPDTIRQAGGGLGTQMKLQYGYDANGNVTSIDDLSGYGLDNRAMTYDGLDRLWTANGPWGDRTYEYDPLNNIQSYTNKGVVTDYVVNAASNRLTSISGGGVTRSYGYNARGEVTSDGLFSFTRDNAGQITAIPGVGTYAYDGNGKRIKSVVNGHTEYSLYRKSGELIQIYDATAATRTDLLQLQGKTVVQIKKAGGADTPTYMAVDLLGSPVVFANASGQVVSRESYGPFGEKLNDVDNVLGYTGHAHDYETGLTYAQARYYDGLVGRFLSTDAVDFKDTDPSTFNRYVYGNNNPYRYTDPSGHEACLAGGACQQAAKVATGTGLSATGAAIFTGAILAVLPTEMGGEEKETTKYDAVSSKEGQKGSGGNNNGQSNGPPPPDKDSAVGSYTNTHESGRQYSGKGTRERSQVSGRRVEKQSGDRHIATEWTRSAGPREAFKDEAIRIRGSGGVDSEGNYNKINSPGERFLKEDTAP